MKQPPQEHAAGRVVPAAAHVAGKHQHRGCQKWKTSASCSASDAATRGGACKTGTHMAMTPPNGLLRRLANVVWAVTERAGTSRSSPTAQPVSPTGSCTQQLRHHNMRLLLSMHKCRKPAQSQRSAAPEPICNSQLRACCTTARSRPNLDAHGRAPCPNIGHVTPAQNMPQSGDSPQEDDQLEIPASEDAGKLIFFDQFV